MKRSLAIWEQVLSPDDPRLAKELDNLAEVYLAQGRYADADRLFCASWQTDVLSSSPQSVEME